MTAMRLPDGSIDGRFFDAEVGAASIDTDRGRLRQEVLSMPALCLTVAQTARLLNVPVAAVAGLLADLERDGFLMPLPGGRYRIAEPMMC